MARKVQKIQDASSDDDTPEVVSHTTSKADVRRNEKALRDFEAEVKARRKARNRERDQKLKERALVTRGGKTVEKRKGVRFVEGEDRDESGMGGGDEDVETRMRRAMRDAADEMESIEGRAEEDSDDEFEGFGEDLDLGGDAESSSDESFAQDEDDAEISSGEDDEMGAEASTSDGEMDEDEEDDEMTPFPTNVHRSGRKANYLADDLFAAAFASQNSKPGPQTHTESVQSQTVKKRRRKFNARPKDLVIGSSGRTIRTLPRLSDPQSQATARSVPSARARKFMDHSLAMKGKRALLMAKKKGWERRPANVGVLKYQGAPHAFTRNTR